VVVTASEARDDELIRLDNELWGLWDAGKPAMHVVEQIAALPARTLLGLDVKAFAIRYLMAGEETPRANLTRALSRSIEAGVTEIWLGASS
jgi:hypothetical protein